MVLFVISLSSLCISRVDSGADSSEVVLTPTDASPAGEITVATGDAQPNGTMGNDSSKPAVSVTKIQPLTNGTTKPPGQKTGK